MSSITIAWISLATESARIHELDELVTYCRDIGLATAVFLEPRAANEDRDREPAGTRWSLADAQRRPDAILVEPHNVFGQVRALRGAETPPAFTAVQRVINQLTIRVPESSSDRPVVWFYGSASVGLEIIHAIQAHRWLVARGRHRRVPFVAWSVHSQRPARICVAIGRRLVVGSRRLHRCRV